MKQYKLWYENGYIKYRTKPVFLRVLSVGFGFGLVLSIFLFLGMPYGLGDIDFLGMIVLLGVFFIGHGLFDGENFYRPLGDVPWSKISPSARDDVLEAGKLYHDFARWKNDKLVAEVILFGVCLGKSEASIFGCIERVVNDGVIELVNLRYSD